MSPLNYIRALCLSIIISAESGWANVDVAAPKVIHVASEYWPGFSNHDGSGLYFEIIKAVYEPVGIAVKFSIEPFKRARHSTVQHHHDVVIGTYSQADRGNNLLLTPHYPINTERVLAIYHKDSTLNWHNFYQRNREDSSEPNPYSSAWIIGYNYDQHLGIKKGFELRRPEQGLKMLVQRRLDVFIEPEDETLVLLQGALADLGAQLRWENVSTNNIYLAFSHNPRAKQLCKIYDQRLPQLYHSGKLQALFAKWQLDISKVNFNWGKLLAQDSCEPIEGLNSVNE
ncbi:transporter substrate-binding domain-containing protein [Dasania sp. GY-MA-18]|uniref:Transporter substrate-binding domain-containing protein n=1 Tax=Dasania phycosphaerae TaxID=2950436 RepID=A0A9J6RJS3_9GAMM|nr:MULTISPECIES: transporter substrate-binding domain-containing protein [Dasania]MCR8922019.1 transporter substrate-binding domain-containing protein [Dasania sp. GY-MA-18]MCZ0864447.1 transporter substrate-binding domain-containing protein [Dasania phycosphaerae]MCZ0868175.1 transporter substrate-binding domain-containing protein [Dasania phycosphaerae]